MTIVVNMLGGSGIGKSTTAAGLYYHMKLAGMNVELVREYVKILAWQGTKIGQFDQVNIFGEQCKLEHTLYDKVDFIVTDSPILLAPIYEVFYHGESIIEEAAIKFLNKASSQGVKHVNILLGRNKPYDTRGRYQTEAEALDVDSRTISFLKKYSMPYHEVCGPDIDRVDRIMEIINE
ncbi:MAG: AAA family ATPase [Candidatus Njordarchaeales archaeon]